ncbi:hypothetical protein DRN72_04395 [Methanosarcinales archaeon]|nr:MAG: hypothetical protein DRN72_04395 [Methanosarcinales archaeon]
MAIYDDVVALTGTPLSQSEVEDLIAIAEEEIDSVLSREGISFSESPPHLYLATLYLSSALVLERELPDSIRLGDLSVSNTRAESYRNLAYKLLREYISMVSERCVLTLVSSDEE